MATPFLSKLGPLAFVAGGPLGVALGVISKVGTAKTLLDIVGGFIRGGGGPDKFPAQARNNIAHGSAWQQAKMLRRIVRRPHRRRRRRRALDVDVVQLPWPQVMD